MKPLQTRRRVSTSRSLRGPVGTGFQVAVEAVPHWTMRPPRAMCLKGRIENGAAGIIEIDVDALWSGFNRTVFRSAVL